MKLQPLLQLAQALLVRCLLAVGRGLGLGRGELGQDLGKRLLGLGALSTNRLVGLGERLEALLKRLSRRARCGRGCGVGRGLWGIGNDGHVLLQSGDGVPLGHLGVHLIPRRSPWQILLVADSDRAHFAQARLVVLARVWVGEALGVVGGAKRIEQPLVEGLREPLCEVDIGLDASRALEHVDDAPVRQPRSWRILVLRAFTLVVDRKRRVVASRAHVCVELRERSVEGIINEEVAAGVPCGSPGVELNAARVGLHVLIHLHLRPPCPAPYPGLERLASRLPQPVGPRP